MRSTLAGLIHPLDKSQLEQHRACEHIHGGSSIASKTLLFTELLRLAGINTSGLRKHYLMAFTVISRLVIPMKPKKRHRRVVTTSVLISAEVIFSRIVGYLNSGRVEVTIVVAVETELGPIPVALVDKKKGCVLRSTTKATLKNALLVEASESGRRKMDIIISDASAVLRNLP